MERGKSSTKKKRLRIEVLKCQIKEIVLGKQGDFALLQPLTKIDVGVKGSITCTLGKIFGSRRPKEGDVIIAYNIHEVGDGWRARDAAIDN